MDPLQVYDNINLGRRIDPQWPEDDWRLRGGRNDWKDWLPEERMEGTVRTYETLLAHFLKTHMSKKAPISNNYRHLLVKIG